MYGIQYPLPPKGVPLARVTSEEPNFNWGVPQREDMLIWSCAISMLTQAPLSELEIVLIEGLRLGSEFADSERDSFKQLMGSLRRYLVRPEGTTASGVMEVWIRELITYIPPFCFDSEADDLIKEETVSEAVDRYLARGFGAPLTALYLLTLRSNYWQEQFRAYSGGIELVTSVLERKAQEAAGFTFAEILGDPFTSPATASWGAVKRSDFFLVREDFVYTYLAVVSAGQHRDALRAITEAMLLLVNVAAKYVGGRLEQYLGEYETWLNEYILAENGGVYSAHMN